MNWNFFLFFPIYLCSTSQRNAYNLFSVPSRSKLSLSFLSFHFAAPCSLHRCSSAFRVQFTRSFEFLNAAFPRATALLLYHIIPSLSMLLDVEDSRLFLSMICEKSIKRAFPLPKEKRSAPFFPKNNLLFDNFHIIRLQPRIHLHEISNRLRICHQLPIPLHTARL